MSIFNKFIGETVELSISGNKRITGIVIDIGSDIIVVYDGDQFIYIPKMHIHHISSMIDNETEIEKPKSVPINFEEETISLRKILMNAKGLFSEVFITSNQSIHGYITNIMNDYFIFYSPVYKMMLIPLQHLKWLIPYKESERPYTLSNEELPLVPFKMTLARTFTEQCKKYEGKLVIFDLGKDPNKIGKLVKMDNSQLQLTIERNKNVFLNIQHIKTLHLP
ncbi:DUF2642 domain-containing protein [Fictibacillus halophilus]|uniref:DUF2642 domain-containing protein n=1 Tax=Fictibacillus halophilus TaxID=1610490 RepID=UPI003634B778